MQYQKIVVAVIVISVASLVMLRLWPESREERVSAPPISTVSSLPEHTDNYAAAAAGEKTLVNSAAPRIHQSIPSLNFQDEEFKRLAVSASLSDRYKAYGWLKECLNERAFAGMNIEYPKLCGLSEGNIDNVELRKKLAVDLAMNAAFGGVENLLEEGPKGRFGAFADDPAGHARLVAEAYALGAAKGEPSALAGQAGVLESQGDRSKANGDLESARAQYSKSLAYSVASALGLAQQNGAPVDASHDPNVEYALEQYQDRLTVEDRKAALDRGIQIAQSWKKS